ncbi:MAG: hypothetical protein R6V58_09470 [Planctomycetota bacterium]
MTLACAAAAAQEWWKPYSPPCTEREDVFEFTEKPSVKVAGKDKYEITFAVKGYCDVTVAIVDAKGRVVRHLASGVLGRNAPEPFRKNALKQTIIWDGKDDLERYPKRFETLSVRVSLGLKPEFHKRLGVTHPKALPGYVWGLAADPGGVYVFLKGGGNISWRKYDHDAKYIKELYPPSGKLPPEKLGGMGRIEYEPGKYAVQAPAVQSGMWLWADWMPVGVKGVRRCRPAVVDGRIYILSSGHGQTNRESGLTQNVLHYFNTDGTTEYHGVVGRVWIESGGQKGGSRGHMSITPHLAASPDGDRIYVTGLHGAGVWGSAPASPVLMSGTWDGDRKAEVIVGEFGSVGADNRHFNNPLDVACDPQGRVYVTDKLNNRVQIFSPDGKYLRTLKVKSPTLVQIHQKTGVVYVVHRSRTTRQRKMLSRITRFSAFPDLEEEQHWDNLAARVMALDSWSPRPRLWVSGRTSGGGTRRFADTDGLSAKVHTTGGVWLQVYEDTGDELKLISDFEKEVRKAAGKNYMEWAGGIKYPVVCDPVTERAYYCNTLLFDLRTGELVGPAATRISYRSELAFDKRGYMHLHREGRDQKYMIRLDPNRVVEVGPSNRRRKRYAEVPYDYGVQGGGYQGVIYMPTTDDKYYSWGMGVNMRGDIAVLNMYKYSPRSNVPGSLSRAEFVQWLKKRQRQEAQKIIEYIRPRPGIDLIGGVIRTFSWTGELTDREAIVVGSYRSNGVQIDEDGLLYFTNGRLPYIAGKPFLRDRGGNFGGKPYVAGNRSPFTGTYIKAPAGKTRFVVRNPALQGKGPPDRPPDLNRCGEAGNYTGPDGDVWAEGVEWMYAGASPIVSYHCSCMDMRAALDWYKRSYVPEMYRHSIGILDTNGNLICRAGRYGNLDDEGIAMTRGAYVSATDNYFVVADWGRRLIAAKLNYHWEETTAIPPR